MITPHCLVCVCLRHTSDGSDIFLFDSSSYEIAEEERGLLVCRDNDTEMLINTNQLKQITSNPQLLSGDSSFHVRTQRVVQSSLPVASRWIRSLWLEWAHDARDLEPQRLLGRWLSSPWSGCMRSTRGSQQTLRLCSSGCITCCDSNRTGYVTNEAHNDERHLGLAAELRESDTKHVQVRERYSIRV